jgi:hypothetical protein
MEEFKKRQDFKTHVSYGPIKAMMALCKEHHLEQEFEKLKL